MRPSVHEDCYQKWKTDHEAKGTIDTPIPERFQQFEPARFGNPGALSEATQFGPDSALHTIAIIGHPRRGKSRLAWAIVKTFFDEFRKQSGQSRWVDYYLFSQLMSEYDRGSTQLLLGSRYLFVDDIGCIDSYGRDRAALQGVIRTRIAQNRTWTFLTFDNLPGFDPGLEEILKNGAVNIIVE